MKEHTLRPASQGKITQQRGQTNDEEKWSKDLQGSDDEIGCGYSHKDTETFGQENGANSEANHDVVLHGQSDDEEGEGSAYGQKSDDEMCGRISREVYETSQQEESLHQSDEVQMSLMNDDHREGRDDESDEEEDSEESNEFAFADNILF